LDVARDDRERATMTTRTYEIRVSGVLPDDAAAEFEDVRVSTADVSTVLTGELADQAALLGLLARLRALGVDVVEVRRVLTPTSPEPDESAPADESSP
jgi:hypothetical protein